MLVSYILIHYKKHQYWNTSKKQDWLLKGLLWECSVIYTK
jgi:hypothetical protein